MAALMLTARIPIVSVLILAMLLGMATPAAADNEVDEAKAIIMEYVENFDPNDPVDEQVRKAENLVIALSELIPPISTACLEFILGAMEFPTVEENTFGGYTVRFPGVGFTSSGQAGQGNYFVKTDGNSQLGCTLT